jgi:hypothetical protein
VTDMLCPNNTHSEINMKISAKFQPKPEGLPGSVWLRSLPKYPVPGTARTPVMKSIPSKSPLRIGIGKSSQQSRCIGSSTEKDQAENRNASVYYLDICQPKQATYYGKVESVYVNTLTNAEFQTFL